MPRYAVILQTTHRVNQFRSTYGFYQKNVHDLEQAGYTVLKLNMEINEPFSQLENLPKNSVGFFWLRMHGSPQSMTATENLQLTTNNCKEIFACLPSILTEDATLFLDSCSTGSLAQLDNMQFAFAKLTLNMPEVQVVAPSEDLHFGHFTLLENNRFAFEMISCPGGKKNISVILGRETKAILQEASLSNTAFEDLEPALKASLQLAEHCPLLHEFRHKFKFLHQSGYDLPNLLTEIIKQCFDSKKALVLVKSLIEDYHAATNHLEGYSEAYSFDSATPLSAAIYNKRSNIVAYLLTQNADPFYSIRNITLLDFAKRRDEEKGNTSIKMRRKKEQDESKMTPIIQEHLNLTLHPKAMPSLSSASQSFFSNLPEDNLAAIQTSLKEHAIALIK